MLECWAQPLHLSKRKLMFFLCLNYNYKTLGAPLCVHPTAGTVQPMSSELLCLGYYQSNTVDVHVRGPYASLSE